jgi:hypothetical protein
MRWMISSFRMRDISFVFAPIRDHAYFEQTALQRQIGNHLLQGTRLTAKVLHFTTCRSSCRIAGQPPLACLHELPRPDIIKVLTDPFGCIGKARDVTREDAGYAAIAAAMFSHGNTGDSHVNFGVSDSVDEVETGLSSTDIAEAKIKSAAVTRLRLIIFVPPEKFTIDRQSLTDMRGLIRR